jgi:hypothetical protein
MEKTMNFTMNDQQAAGRLTYDLLTARDVAHCISLVADSFDTLIDSQIYSDNDVTLKYSSAAFGLIKYAARHMCITLGKANSDMEEANRSQPASEEIHKCFQSELIGHYEG